MGMKITETIKVENGDWWICPCGNHPGSDGYYTCDENGYIVSPQLDGPWNEVSWICGKCCRILNSETLEVVGVAGEEVAFANVKLAEEHYG